MIFQVFLPLMILASSAAVAAESTPPRGNLMLPRTLNLKAPDRFRARFRTTQGDFVIEVTRSWSPNGADRVYNLVRSKWYDDNYLYDVTPNSMVRFGISSTPVRSKTWTVKATAIRDDMAGKSNMLGYVSFDSEGPNTRTTRLLVNLAENSKLDLQGIRPIGLVVEGMPVLQKLAAAKADPQRLAVEGEEYVKKSFPKMDQIKSAAIESERALPAKAPAVKPPAFGSKPSVAKGKK